MPFPRRLLFWTLLTAALSGCGKGPGLEPPRKDDASPTPPSVPATYRVSGTVQGLIAGSLRLKLNGTEAVVVNAGATSFQFTTALASSAAYSVAVAEQGALPAMSCAVDRASGMVAGAHVTNVAVICPALQSVSVSSSSLNLYPATSFAMKATGLYADGVVRDLTSVGSWSSDDPGVVALDGSAATAGAAGSTVARFAFGPTGGSLGLTVKNGTLSSLTISPGDLSLPAGISKAFRVTGTFSDGSVQDLTSTAAWSSSDVLVASVDSSGAKGRVTANTAGSATITAQVGPVGAGRAVTVTNATIADLDLSPAFVNGGLGIERPLKATATDTDGAAWDVTDVVTWSSTAADKASVTSSGWLRLNAAGTATIGAALGSLNETMPVQVLSKTVTSIAIENAGDPLPAMAQRRLKAVATYSDLSSEDVTEQAAWVSGSPETAATVDVAGDRGLVIGVAAGVSRITASLGGVAGFADLAVTDDAPASLKMSPGETLLPKSIHMNFRLYGVYTDASEHELTRSATWSSSNAALAEVGNGGPTSGALTNKYAGSSATTVTVSAALGSSSATAAVLLTPSALSSIAITPATVEVAPFRTIRLRAFGQFNDGGSVDLSELVSWSSDAKSVASVANAEGSKGLVSSLTEGTATISAKLSAITAMRAVTVSSTNPENVIEEGMGLKGEYFGALNFASYKGSRIDGTVDFNWAAGLAPLGVGDNFSIRWTGFVKAPTGGTYQFCTRSDDGVRLSIGGAPIISNWTDHAETENCANVALTAGEKTPVLLEFYEKGGSAVIRLFWTPPLGSKVVVPRAALFDR